MYRPLKNYTIIVALLIAMIVVCSVVCMATAHWMRSRGEHDETSKDHHWVHEALELKEGEIPELELLEGVYSKEKLRLEAEMDTLKGELAKQLRSKKESDQEVVDSVMEIHLVHGKIQQLEIKHYFDMLAILPPSKQIKLRELATESLSAPPK